MDRFQESRPGAAPGVGAAASCPTAPPVLTNMTRDRAMPERLGMHLKASVWSDRMSGHIPELWQALWA